MALNHCDSAQRASASQRGATPQVSTAATRFALKGQHRPALCNPFRVRVQTGYQPEAAFIRIRGFTCPRLICASLSGSVAALTSSINANTFNAQMSPRTSFVDEPNYVLEYNTIRLHSAIGYVTPLAMLEGRQQAIFDERDRKLGNSEPKLVPPNLPGSPKIPSAIRNQQRIVFLSPQKTGLCREAPRAPLRCR